MMPFAIRMRIEACIEVWGDILEGRLRSRAQILRRLLREYRVRGLDTIPRRRRKELFTLFLIGRHGLGLHEEAEEAFRRYFGYEARCERALEEVLKGRGLEDALFTIFDFIDEELVFDTLRVAAAKATLGLGAEEDLLRAYQMALKDFPYLRRGLMRFMSHFIALKLAMDIAQGKVRDREEKEYLKIQYSNRLRAPPPSDKLVRELSRRVFLLSSRTLDRFLS